MPMSGSNYVAPTWVDNAPPALDATELQAMCNAIVQNQGDAAALQAALQALTTTVNGKAQVVTGSYVGIGAQGVNNPTIISFTSIPKVLVVVGTSGNYEFLCCRIPPEEVTITCMTNGNTGVYLKTSGNSVSFYSTSSAKIQLSQSGIRYYYAGIL